MILLILSIPLFFLSNTYILMQQIGCQNCFLSQVFHFSLINVHMKWKIFASIDQWNTVSIRNVSVYFSFQKCSPLTILSINLSSLTGQKLTNLVSGLHLHTLPPTHTPNAIPKCVNQQKKLWVLRTETKNIAISWLIKKKDKQHREKCHQQSMMKAISHLGRYTVNERSQCWWYLPTGPSCTTPT